MANQTLPKLSAKDIRRFFSKISKTTDPNICWEWKGTINANGYGTMRLGYGNYGSHRISYLHFYCIDPDQLFVCHTCDNRLCVNPKHLFLGTKADNTRDMIKKQRNSFGEKNGIAKLNPEMVRAIRERKRNSNLSQSKIAKEFGVSQTAVFRVLHNQLWKHIE